MGRPFTPVSLQGRLTGLGGEDLPTIVIVAHYDAFGVAPVCPCPSCPAGESSFRLQGSRVGGSFPRVQGLGHTKGASVRFGQSWGLVGRGSNPSWTGKED